MTARDFNADVVVWNIEKILNDKTPHFDPKQAAQARARIPTLVGWKAIDEYTVELTTRVVDSLFPYMSYFFYSSPRTGRSRATTGSRWRAALRHRPLQVRPGRAARAPGAVSARDYWDKARVPKLDKVLLIPMPEAATRTAALLAGQVDWIEVPSPDAIPASSRRAWTIVTNIYPHNWAYQLSIVEARRGTTSGCARPPTLRSIATG